MTVAFALALAQFGNTACIAAWMISGVVDNWRHPALNERAVADVLGLDGLATEAPEAYAEMKHRRVENRRLVRAAFYAIVLWESVAALLLSFGTVALGAALLGLADADAARGWAILGCLAFVVNWSGFLVGGNYFCYWYAQFPAQATHFFLVVWGVAGIVLLALPPAV